MPINRGSTPTTKIYRGSTEILKRFRGLQLVYSSGPGKVRNWRIVPVDVPNRSTIYSGSIGFTHSTHNTRVGAEAAIADWFRTIPRHPARGWDDVVTTSTILPRLYNPAGSGRRIYSDIVANSAGVESVATAADAAIAAWTRGISGAIPLPYTHREFTSAVVRQSIGDNNQVIYSNKVDNSEGVESTETAANAAVAAWKNGISVPIEDPYTHRDFTSTVVRQAVTIAGMATYSDSIANDAGVVNTKSHADAAVAAFTILNSTGVIPPPYTHRDFTTKVVRQSAGSSRTVYSNVINRASGTRSSRSVAEAAIARWRRGVTGAIRDPYTTRDFTSSVTPRTTSGSRTVTSGRTAGSGTANTESAANTAAAGWIRAAGSPSLPYTSRVSGSSSTRTLSSRGDRVSSATRSSSGTASTRDAAAAAVTNRRYIVDNLGVSLPYTQLHLSSSINARNVPGRTITSGAVERGGGQIAGGTDGGYRAAGTEIVRYLTARRSRVNDSRPSQYTSTSSRSSRTLSSNGLITTWSAWFVHTGTAPATTVYDWSVSYYYSYASPDVYIYTWNAYYQDSYILTTTTTVYDWSVSYRYSYVSSSTTITYRWSAFYRYYHIPVTAVISYKWTASYRYSRISTTVIIRYGWTVSYRHYHIPIVPRFTYDWVASYQYSRVVTAITITYEARWLAPSTGLFTNYRIERTTLDGTPLDDIIIDAAVLGYVIGITLQRLRIRVERPMDMVIGPWSDWI